MTTVTASAPGKVLITGEYAVLGGATAISMAVSRRATARVRPADTGNNELVVSGYRNGRWTFPSSDPDGASRLSDEAGGTLDLFAHLWRRSTLDMRKAWVVELDTAPFYDPGSEKKYGLGSSAALSAAAMAVMNPGASDLPPMVNSVHAEFQGGKGSGVDVATALAGGVISYRMGQAASGVPWPADLKFRLLWSGHSATTRTKLERLADRTRDSFTTIDPKLVRAADVAADVWLSGDADSVLESISAYVRCLREFDLDHELGIFDAGHWQRVEDAWTDGAVIYKPCGAGGGDVGIALGTDERALDAFVARAAEAGFQRLELVIDPVGLSIGSASVGG